ncbi:MAG: hypothetical protein P0S94_00005, partial [Simkaniaceae bacterium]|nr:hypothetical protein [Simkaniaceae bacterium]
MLTKLRAFLLFLLLVSVACPATVKQEGCTPDEARELLTNLVRLTLNETPHLVPSIFYHDTVPKQCQGIGRWWQKHKKPVIICATVAVIVTIAILSGKKSETTAADVASIAKGNKNLPPQDAILFDAAPTLVGIADEYIGMAQNFFPKEMAESLKSPNVESLSDKTKDYCSYFMHSLIDEISEYLSLYPAVLDQAKKIAQHPLTGGMLSQLDWDAYGKCTDSYESSRTNSHAYIDKAFNTNYAKNFTENSDLENLLKLGNIPNKTIGVMPPPGQIGSLARCSLNTIKKIFNTGKQTKNIASYLGLTKKEITTLAKSGKLRPHISETIDHIYRDSKHLESLNRFNRAKPIYKQYSKKPFPEPFIRDTIERLGIRTYPRPKGIPNNYITKFSKKVGGI